MAEGPEGGWGAVDPGGPWFGVAWVVSIGILGVMGFWTIRIGQDVNAPGGGAENVGDLIMHLILLAVSVFLLLVWYVFIRETLRLEGKISKDFPITSVKAVHLVEDAIVEEGHVPERVELGRHLGRGFPRYAAVFRIRKIKMTVLVQDRHDVTKVHVGQARRPGDRAQMDAMAVAIEGKLRSHLDGADGRPPGAQP